MVGRHPKATLTRRIPLLCDLASGRRVIHVGFADAGCRTMNQRSEAWLHEHLAATAKELVGIDLDQVGVDAARAAGYEAYVADCRDPSVLERLGLQPAELVIAGEVIEHLDDPGGFLDGLQHLVAPGGRLVVTTPNATALINALAAVIRREINHPDHVAMFSQRTLDNLLRRHGWLPKRWWTYRSEIKEQDRVSGAERVLLAGVRVVHAFEGLAARWGAAFVAEGLIVEAIPDPRPQQQR